MSHSEEREAAQQVMDKTRQWAADFVESSGQRVAEELGSFSLEGAVSLPPGIARPSLRITPQLYRREWFSQMPYTEGYIAAEPKYDKPLTRDSKYAWSVEVPLWVDPTPLTFGQYRERAAEPNPWLTVDQEWVRARFAPYWQTTPDKLAAKWNEYKSRRFYDEPQTPNAVVYRALGVLPAWSPIQSNDQFTYALRIDPLLNDAEGKPTDSCRMYNYTNTTGNSAGNYSHQFPAPYHDGGRQIHIAPYELKEPDFYGPDHESRGWKMPPKDYNFALFLSEHQTGGPEVYLAVHLAGALATAETADRP